VGGPNSNEGTDTLVLYVYYNPSMISSFWADGGVPGGNRTWACRTELTTELRRTLNNVKQIDFLTPSYTESNLQKPKKPLSLLILTGVQFVRFLLCVHTSPPPPSTPPSPTFTPVLTPSIRELYVVKQTSIWFLAKCELFAG
jgi:hypothetical protein